MVNLAQPTPGEKIIDICCGTGIFLVKALNFVWQQSPSEADLKLFGVDKEANGAEATKISLMANSAKDFKVICGDSFTGRIIIFDHSHALFGYENGVGYAKAMGHNEKIIPKGSSGTDIRLKWFENKLGIFKEDDYAEKRWLSPRILGSCKTKWLGIWKNYKTACLFPEVVVQNQMVRNFVRKC